MSPAEKIYWLGFEVMASRALAQSVGPVLAALIRVSPKPLSKFPYSAFFHFAGARQADLNPLVTKVRVCRLREALADIGFEGAIGSIRGEYGLGTGSSYFIPSEIAARIKAWVERQA